MTANSSRIGPKGLVVVLGLAFAIEGALYSAITPILPVLSRQHGLGDFMAGMLLSSYSAGLVVGSLLCVLILRKTSPRDVAAYATAALAVTTLVFAWADSSELLLGSRLAQGIASGTIYTANVTWLLSAWPVERRGEAIAAAMAPAVVGTIAGPLIGTLAIPLGLAIPYTIVAVVCLCITMLMLRMPRPQRGAVPIRMSLPSRRSARTIALAAAGAATLAGTVIGLVNLSGPFLLTERGGSDYLSGVTFTAAAVATVFAARPLGRLIDRAGAGRTTKIGLLILAVLLPFLGLATSPVFLVVVVVMLLVSVNFSYISASTLLTKAGQRSGWTLQFSSALTSVLWGLGETIGPLLGGLGMDTVGPRWTTALCAAVVVAGLFIIVVVSQGRDSSSMGGPTNTAEMSAGVGEAVESESARCEGP